MTSDNKVDRAILFSQCQFFIDYRSSQNKCDRSLRLGNELEKKYGANIVEQPHPSSTTHIIYKNGSLATRLFAKKHNIPLVDPMWLEHCIKKRRLIKIDKYQVINDENEQPPEEVAFAQLAITNKDPIVVSTPKNKTERLQDLNVDSSKKPKKALYTPSRDHFDQGHPNEYFDHHQRVITLDNLGMNLPDDNHILIHRYGCSVARRQNQENAQRQSELKDKPSVPPVVVQNAELSTALSIPSQSQSSPVIYFANNVRQAPKQRTETAAVSPSTTFDFDSDHHYAALGNLPQSTPIARPSPPLNNHDSGKSNEIVIEKVLPNPQDKQYTPPQRTIDFTSFTKVTPLNQINSKTKSRLRFEIDHEDNNVDHDFVLPNVPEVIVDAEIPVNNDYVIPRPPPLLALSQAIRTKHPEQLIDTKINNALSVKDLPTSPANYSFVFYRFIPTQLEEAKRLTRRMGDCFSFETIDMTTTHVILSDDDPQMELTPDLVLALIYGCRIVTLDWLKSSSRIGEWLTVNKYEPKRFFQANPSLNVYRKARQQQKPINLFNECGLIYLTSIAKQRSLLLKLITLLGGNITVSRNSAKVVVGQSSKPLNVIVYPQVSEEWVIDSIKSGECLPINDYLIKDKQEEPVQ